MAAVVRERFGMRRADGQEARREYYVTGVTDEDAARTAALAAAPTTVTVKSLTYNREEISCSIEELETKSTDGTTITDGVWIATVCWTNPQWSFQPPNSFRISLDISGTTQKITQSRKTVASIAAGTPLDFRGGINVQRNGDKWTAEGCEIIIPATVYTLNYTFDNATVTPAWIRKIAGVVGSVNSDSWHGYEPGECLLTRVSGQQRPDTNWDICFGTAISFNETGISFILNTIGADVTQTIDKKGWDYLWVYYNEVDVDAGAVKLSQLVPAQVNVEEVYRRNAYGAQLAI